MDMKRHRTKPDGYDTICRRCHTARLAAKAAGRVAAGLCVRAGCTRPRDGDTTRCVEHWAAAAEADRARRAADPKKYRQARRDRRAADPEKYREDARARYAADPEKYRQAERDRRAYRAARTNAEIAAKRAELRPDGLKECRKCALRLPFEAFSAHRVNADGLRDECRSCNGARLLRIAAPRWTADDECACVYCGAAFEHVDHVWPSADGGPDAARNLVPACASCNLSKNARHVLEFVAERLGADVVDAVLAWPVRYVDLSDAA